MTAVSQPLDVGPNSALETRMKSLTHRWHGRVENAGRKLDQYSMMKHVVFDAVEQVFSNPNTVITAFRRTGLVPWRRLDPHQLKKLTPGTIFKHHHHEEIFPDPGPSPDLSPQLGNPVAAAPTPSVVTDTEPGIDPEHGQGPAPVPLVVVPEADLETEASPATTAVSGEVLDTETASSPDTVTDCPSLSSVPTPPMSRESSVASASSSVREASSSSSTSLTPSNDPSFDLLVAEQKELTQETKVWLLQRHELLLGPPKVKVFEDLYAKNRLHCPNTEFQCWLLLKQQAVGTEAEALARLVSSRQPKNVPKKKTTRKSDLPEGDERYNALSDGFSDYFVRVESRKKGKRKVPPTESGSAIPVEPAKKVKKTKKNHNAGT